ncbi:Hypothetical_protein [Hexamita inflata]|uniref:Hypothetical_protein n=1 Tax=Hexamita inflata TaxID=28002 RepID=A0AA86RGU4_9EUKA|nr:Hypothetical protein HINF_LOCUS65899 [Hexamita inflata]
MNSMEMILQQQNAFEPQHASVQLQNLQQQSNAPSKPPSKIETEATQPQQPPSQPQMSQAELQKRFDQLSKVHSETLQNLKQIQSAEAKAQKENTKKSNEIAALQTEQKDLKKQIQQLTEQVDVMKQNDPNVIKAQAKQAMAEQIQKSNKQIKQLTDQFEKQIAELTQQLTDQTNTLNNERQSHQESTTQLQNIVDYQNRELSTAQAELKLKKQLLDELNSVQRMRDEKSSELMKTLQQLNTQNQGKQIEIKRLHGILAQQQIITEQKYNELQHEIGTQQNEIQQLEKSNLEFKTQNQNLQQILERNQLRTQQDLNSMQVKNEQEQQKNRDEFILSLETHIEYIDSVKKELIELQAQHKLLQEQYTKTKADLENALNINVNLQINFREELNKLQTVHQDELQQTTIELQKNKTGLVINQQKMSELKNLSFKQINSKVIDEMAILKLENSKLGRQLEQSEKTVKQLTQIRNEQEWALKKYTESPVQPLKSAENADPLLINQINQQKIIIQQLQQDIQTLTQQQQQQKVDNQSFASQKKELSKLETKSYDKQQMLRTVSSTNDLVQKQLQQKEFIISSLRKQVKELETEVEYSQMRNILERKK